MSRVTHYQAVGASTGGAVGQGAQSIARKGRIAGVNFRMRSTGGASPGFYSIEAVVNNLANGSAEQSAINRLISVAAATFHTATSTSNSGNHFIPVDYPVNDGDQIGFNQTQSGTAAASCVIMVDFYVVESE